MNRFQFTPQAIGDLFDIWSYIAAENPEAADEVEREPSMTPVNSSAENL